MSCFVMRCHVRHAFAGALPFPPAYRSSFSVPSSPRRLRPAGGTLCRAYCARAQARVGAGAVCAPDCPRARPRAGATEGRRCDRDIPGHVMRCHVRHAFAGALPSRSVPPSRSVLLRSVRPPPAGGANAAIRNVRRVLHGGAGPFTARICVRARARVCAGAVCAPDCPRAARRRAHLSCPLPWVFFRAGAGSNGEAASGWPLRPASYGRPRLGVKQF